MSDLVERLVSLSFDFAKSDMETYRDGGHQETLNEAITALSQEPGTNVVDDFAHWIKVQTVISPDHGDGLKEGFSAAAHLYARRMAEKDARIAELMSEGNQFRHWIDGQYSSQLCCSGHECGCMGATQGQEIIHHIEQDAKKALQGDSQCLAHQ